MLTLVEFHIITILTSLGQQTRQLASSIKTFNYKEKKETAKRGGTLNKKV